ncbi:MULTISPECIES: phosphate ABC transporter permease subunit PstC [unclassified Methanoregula]|uniref:phosphate ABC transporter permease subunit PstC n=1 Tax=unclassified Methanoregula TaxID=2649730 RepID=UPI0009CB759D|nr:MULTISPECIES: phosphate ABC transporter permease subunit PstC [unclassified Methanoregula]OPX63634.1 MAG: phosphate transporter permease subunit PtsA [Methanoregula sp. PtaB.Bin085]OPY36200.1 MAG: phosphate transporter permease subunit PtsA [Methanoregula sp. PtaU1.Bin006]
MIVNIMSHYRGTAAVSAHADGSSLFREKTIRTLFFFTAFFAVIVVSFILLFLVNDGLPIFAEVGVADFLFGPDWAPTAAEPLYGIFPLIIGTILVTIGAMAFAVPLSIGCAVYIAELASPRMKAVLKPAIELLAGIPSVVYGFFGLIVLTDFIRIVFNLPTGETWLAASVLLGIMALPTIVSVSEDAISAVPREFKEGSLATGATTWQTISRVIVPAALSGIAAAIILGIGRAVGETMAVMMVAGNAAIIPDPFWNILSPLRTLTGTLGIEMGEVPVGSVHYNALFGVAVVLLVITLTINLLAVAILRYLKEGRISSPAGKPFVSFETKENILFISGMILFGLLLVSLTFLPWGLGPVLLLAGLLWFTVRPFLSERTVQQIAFAGITAATLTVLAILVIILQDIVINGIPALSWEFLTQSPLDSGREGGIFPAIVGTLYLVTGAIAIALPIGIGAAVYLVEYTREGRVTQLIRTGVDLLNGTPSIVFGLFGFAFIVLFLNTGVSMLAGQVTLALMVLPTVIRTAEESLKSIPQSLREGSLALGATQWQTIGRVVLPPAVPGILTGAILSIGRAAGETAPIMFTAVVFSSRFLPDSVFDPVMALPYHLFILATNVPGASANKYGTALVLLLLVIGFYSVAIVVRTQFRNNMRV